MAAKSYAEIPGPSAFWIIRHMLPGGVLQGKDIVEINSFFRTQYGDIFKIPGFLGKPDTVMTFNPRQFETVFRNESVCPVRESLFSFEYYRKNKRPDVFKNFGGLVSEQGEQWGMMRSMVNPILMKDQIVRKSLKDVDEITNDFLKKVNTLRDPQTNVLNRSLMAELEMWSLESIAYIALGSRLGLLSDNPDPNGRRLSENVKSFISKSSRYDHQMPHFWKYYETKGFKEFLKTLDNITDICLNYIEKTKERIAADNNPEPKSVLEKLLKIDTNLALVMAIDMLMAGIDTTAASTVITLYHIAKNADKQDRLREEIRKILPEHDSPLTEENTTNMPYLRSCIKEAMRVTPIVPGNIRTNVKELVVEGYQVPEGVRILMLNDGLSTSEEFIKDGHMFMPERWLKKGPEACPAGKPKSPFAYVPFGFGPRSCVGRRIAQLEMETLIARMVRSYKVHWVSENDLQTKCGFVRIPYGDKFALEPIK